MNYLAIDWHNYETLSGVTKQDVLMALAYKLKDKDIKGSDTKTLFDGMVQDLRLHPIVVSAFCTSVLGVSPYLEFRVKQLDGVSYFSGTILRQDNNQQLLKAFDTVMASKFGSKLAQVLKKVGV